MSGLAASTAVYALQVALVIGACGGVLGVVRVPVSTRLLAWRTILILCLILPWVPTTVAPDVASPAARVALRSIAQEAAATASTWSSLLILGLGVGAGARGAWLILRLRRLRRLRFDSAPIHLDARLTCIRDEVAPRAELRTHPDVVVPATFGWRRPIVLLPSRFDTLPEAAQRSVLRHELLHVARRDWLWLLCEEVITCLFWAHPVVRWAVCQSELACEQLIDDAVIDFEPKHAYMQAMLTLAIPGDGAWPALASVTGRTLKARFEHLNDQTQPRFGRIVFCTTALIAALGASTWAALAVFPEVQAERRVDRDGPVRVKDGVPTLSVMRQVKAVYPSFAASRRIQGEVTADVVVGRDGSVKDVRIVQSVPGLDDAVTTALRQWRFTPPIADGTAVEAVVTVLQKFTLR
jgi:TonB family protein